MENKSLNIHPTRKSRSPPSSYKTMRSNSTHQNQCVNENLKKTVSTTPKVAFGRGEGMADNLKLDFSSKTEDTSEKKLSDRNFGDLKRRNSTSNAYRKKFDVEEREWALSPRIMKTTSPCQSKYSWSDRGSWSSSGSVALTTFAREKKQYMKNKLKRTRIRVDFAEDRESSTATPLLSLAVREQKNIIEMLHVAKEELQRKVMELQDMKNKKLKTKNTVMGDHESFTRIPPARKTWLWQRGVTFGDFYTNNLDEVFQVWIHLFCFIINLRINLIRVVNVAGTEPFRPNSEVERGIVTRAIEGVKFFSFMKMKALQESIHELASYSKKSETEIIDDERKISSPFLLEMDFIGKKAKEMLHQLKKETEKRAMTG